MNDEALKWQVLEGESLLRTPVFEVFTQRERAPDGLEGSYVAVRAPDWVMVIPELGDRFVMVRQWRHAARCLTLEFPGGVRDGDEDPAQTAARELLEETGFRAGQLIHLGSCSPNPALFTNRFHCYLARELEATGVQHLDADERLRYELHPIEEVIREFGSPLCSHALMGAALAFYLRRSREEASAAQEPFPDARSMWQAAGLSGPPEAWSFGEDPDGLARLVLEGKKRATSSAGPLYALEGEPLPKPGQASVLLDSQNRPICVLWTTRVYTAAFCDVTARHAALEGEGDLSLAHWRQVHRDFFTRELEAAGLAFREDLPVVCEEFEILFRP